VPYPKVQQAASSLVRSFALQHKLKIVEEEADETLYWLEIIVEAQLLSYDRLAFLMKETDEIVAMTVASIKTKRNQQR